MKSAPADFQASEVAKTSLILFKMILIKIKNTLATSPFDSREIVTSKLKVLPNNKVQLTITTDIEKCKIQVFAVAIAKFQRFLKVSQDKLTGRRVP